MKTMRERLFHLFGALLLIGSLLLGWFWLGYQSFINAPLQNVEAGLEFEVHPGASLTRVARQLEDAGHISSARYFIWMTRLSGHAHQLHAGEYSLEADMTARQLLQNMVDGRVRLYALTLLEGWNFHQVMTAVRQSPYLKQALAGLTDGELMARLGYPEVHPEGRFFPDTYHFPRHSSDVDFLRHAYLQMQEVLAYEWQQRSEGLPLNSAEEALVLASIIEKETGLASERAAVAGVFVRRLQKGMRLQTDPTVIYGRGSDFEGRLRRLDLTTDTPYNTYTRHGLPPTPIAMPGRDSIHAALHPADGKALYFVSRGDGSHQFSATLEEHNRAVQIHQLKRRP
ncbi:MAG: endolytic transglycosylase MltG [Thiohalomonadaceae bacterium]